MIKQLKLHAAKSSTDTAVFHSRIVNAIFAASQSTRKSLPRLTDLILDLQLGYGPVPKLPLNLDCAVSWIQRPIDLEPPLLEYNFRVNVLHSSRSTSFPLTHGHLDNLSCGISQRRWSFTYPQGQAYFDIERQLPMGRTYKSSLRPSYPPDSKLRCGHASNSPISSGDVAPKGCSHIPNASVSGSQ